MIPTSPSNGFQPGHGGSGVLLLHGLDGATDQTRMWADGLHEAGYTVLSPALPGNGLAAARTAYSRLREECRSVAVVGHSMGGVLALLLAEEYPADAVITLSAPLKLTRHGAAGCRSELSAVQFADLKRLIRRSRRNLFAVCAPLLTIQSEDDALAHADCPRLIAGGVSSSVRKSVRLTRSISPMCPEAEREQALGEMLSFLNLHLIDE